MEGGSSDGAARGDGGHAALRALPMGRHAVLVETGDAARALSLAQWAAASGIVAREVVPAAATVLFDGVPDAAELVARLEAWPAGPPTLTEAVVELAVVYDGPDLDDVARRWGMSSAEAAATHASQHYVVAFCGFAPGFAYLAGLPPALAVPRLETPRTRVPAGSVAVADRWSAVYPSASPGGWRLLGHTDARLFDPDRAAPALLVPGTRVRLVVQRS